VTTNVALGTGCNDLPCRAEHGSILNESNIVEKRSAARRWITAEGEELAYVGDE
jgi:hypothetical protein